MREREESADGHESHYPETFPRNGRRLQDAERSLGVPESVRRALHARLRAMKEGALAQQPGSLQAALSFGAMGVISVRSAFQALGRMVRTPSASLSSARLVRVVSSGGGWLAACAHFFPSANYGENNNKKRRLLQIEDTSAYERALNDGDREKAARLRSDLLSRVEELLNAYVFSLFSRKSMRSLDEENEHVEKENEAAAAAAMVAAAAADEAGETEVS